MPTRQDLQRVTERCDADAPSSWLESVAGGAPAVHAVVSGGTPRPPATAPRTGDLALRDAAGISELPGQPVRFGGGTPVGVRNPARQAQPTIAAGAR